jgi:hypothetical protein
VRASSKRILFISRDRGSVQTTLPVIAALRSRGSVDVQVVSLEVSRSLLNERCIPSEPLDEIEFMREPGRCIATVLERIRPAVVVSGSSPAQGALPETPEQHAIIESRRRSIPTLGVLDYWGMYRERFGSPGDGADLTFVPDRLCVLDSVSRGDLTAFGIPAERLVVTHNPWMDAVVELAREPPPPAGITLSDAACVLFVSQPLAETRHVRAWPYDQDDVLKGLIEALPAASPARRHVVLLWAHPAEDSARWRDLSRFHRPDVDLRVARERGAAILAHVDLVVSSHSTVAYEALHYATPCITFRPGGFGMPPLIFEHDGLCPAFTGHGELRDFLGRVDLPAERVRLQRLRAQLSAQKVFFSDGRATERVVAEIANMPAGDAKRMDECSA